MTPERMKLIAAKIVASQLDDIEYCEVYEHDDLQDLGQDDEETWEAIYDWVNSATVKIYIDGEEYA